MTSVAGPLQRRAAISFCALLGALAPAACSTVAASAVDVAATAVGDTEELLIVDCLLPGRVRRLGRRQTYVSRRRPLRTTAAECEIRGGEYTAFDRASLKTSLAVWLDAAKAGDATAQTHVGEMFEKGLGVPPDHEAAAAWYLRAAEQGHAAAQINLGQLYETGRGVPQDSVEALSWYRRAAGLPGAIALETAPASRDSPSSRPEPPPNVDAAAVERDRLRERVATLETALDDADADTRRLRQELVRANVRAEELESANARIGERLERERGALASGRREVTALERTLADLRAQLDEARQRGDRLPELERRVADQDLALSSARERVASLERDVARQRHELTRHVEELESSRKLLADLQAKRDRAAEAALSITTTTAPATAHSARPRPDASPPVIELIDPPAHKTRSIEIVAAYTTAVATRQVVGRVTAPAGIFSFIVDGAAHPIEDGGLFRVEAPMTGEAREVSLVAVDRLGQRTEFVFELRPRSPKKRGKPRSRKIEFGRYYALIIGNDEYAQLPDLNMASSDARSLEVLLRERFDFRTKLLLDATRYELLSALNELRGELNKTDNLLIYYAGHGELESSIQRGYWLPTDAERDNPANWISIATVTDYLGVISAKHAIVIADSCYSGALTRSAMARLESGISEEARTRWLETMAAKRSRTALSSGGLQPVLDSGGGDHSVFARALLDVLGETEDVLEARRLFLEVSQRVTHASSELGAAQTPEYAPIKFAGHEGGDFFFVPTR